MEPSWWDWCLCKEKGKHCVSLQEHTLGKSHLPRSWKGTAYQPRGGYFPQALGLSLPWSWTRQPSQLQEINFCCLHNSVCDIFKSSPGRRRPWPSLDVIIFTVLHKWLYFDESSQVAVFQVSQNFDLWSCRNLEENSKHIRVLVPIISIGLDYWWCHLENTLLHTGKRSLTVQYKMIMKWSTNIYFSYLLFCS